MSFLKILREFLLITFVAALSGVVAGTVLFSCGVSSGAMPGAVARGVSAVITGIICTKGRMR